MSKQKLTKTMLKKRILPTTLVALAIPLILCIFIPLEIYGNNLDEFMFSLFGFLPMCIVFALLLSAIIFCSIFFLPQKGHTVACAVIAAFALMFFLQGTYLNGGMSSLAGDNLGDQTVSVFSKILNLVIWIVVIAGAVVFALLVKKELSSLVVMIVCAVVLIAQIMGPVVVLLSNDQVFVKKEDRFVAEDAEYVHRILTKENLTTISNTGNIFYFCVDRFDQEYAERALQECPEVFDSLKGFTSFTDNIALYGHTFPGVSNLLTSKKFDTDNRRGEHLDNVYEQNDTLQVLAQNGYKINLYTQPYYAYTDAYYLPDYVANVSDATTYQVKNPTMLSLNMMGISAYRCLPMLAKPLAGSITSATCNNQVVSTGANGHDEFSTDMKNTWQSISSQVFSTTNDKNFTFIHIEGCHGVDYDEEWNSVGLFGDKDIMISLKNSFAIIDVYLQAMKDAGVYDDATIVITGDHGTPVNDFASLSSPTRTALFFKPSGSDNSDVKYSNAQVSHDNVWAAIFQSEGIAVPSGLDRSLFDVDENEQTTRYYYWHTYGLTFSEYVYEIKGSAKDFANWTLIKTTHFDRFIMD
ncbi:MAG: hypothetical protein IJV77_05690 [Clostridia bacterium]|nr:hypothetical protein [Clostridia bacterium]